MCVHPTIKVSEEAAQQFGDWAKTLALSSSCGDQRLLDAMANREAESKVLELILHLADSFNVSRPLLERPALFSLFLGRWGSKLEAIATIKAARHRFQGHVESIIENEKFCLLRESGKYEFVKASVYEVVGHHEAVTTESLYLAMVKQGFIIAPHESALTLRMVFMLQEDDSHYHVLSEPVSGAGGMGTILMLSCYSGVMWLDSYCSKSDRLWSPSAELLLCREVKPSSPEA